MRAFADSRGHVRVVPRQGAEPYTATVENVFVERDFYSVHNVDEELDHELIEKGIYAAVEGHVAPIFRKLLLTDFGLGGQDRLEFASFMALQLTRGRQFRAFMERTTDQLGKAMLRAASEAPPEYWEARHAEWEETREGAEPPRTMTEYERHLMRRGEGFLIQPSREHTVEMSFVALQDLTFIFFSMRWRLVCFREPLLFSSEHPISYWQHPTRRGPMVPPAAVTAEEVRFPLSPTRALVLTPGGPRSDERSYEGTVAGAARLNWGTLSFPPSERLLLSPDVARHPLPGAAELRKSHLL
jgi:hypothetical protein